MKNKMQNKTYQRIRKTLNGMRARCYNQHNNRYKNYGARGIKVCSGWMGKEGILNFYNWAINNGYKEGLTIDRINNDGNYEPNNCRWITPKEQSNNRTTNRFIVYNGKTHTIAEWSRILNINYALLQSRLNKDNWSIEESFFGKKKSYRRKVNQYDLKGNFIKQYNSITEAKKYYGKNIHIIACCQKKRKQAGGYIWRYANEDNSELSNNSGKSK